MSYQHRTVTVKQLYVIEVKLRFSITLPLGAGEGRGQSKQCVQYSQTVLRGVRGACWLLAEPQTERGRE